MTSASAWTRLGVRLVLALVLLITAAEASHRNKFELIGTATFDKDPTDPSNFVIRIDNTAGFGGVRRTLNAKISQLDEHITLRYYFVGPKTCGLGSPRVQLAIDLDGNGIANGNAHGSIGPSPLFTACGQNVWRTEDLTISITEGTQAHIRWSFAFDLDEDGVNDIGSGGLNWDALKAVVASFPDHIVLRATLVEDPGTPVPGVTFYDDITFGERTLEDQRDVSGNN